MQEVGTRVVPAYRGSPVGIDLRRRHLPSPDLPLLHHRKVAVKSRYGRGGVDDPRPAGVGLDHPGIANLATTLGVERGDVEKDLRPAVARVEHLEDLPGRTRLA